MMYCTCSSKNLWIPNEPSSLRRQSHDNSQPTNKKSALKTTSRSTCTTPKKVVHAFDVRNERQFSTLPRRQRPKSQTHVATIFPSGPQYAATCPRQQMTPWQPQCTCRNSCYLCNIWPLSGSVTALAYQPNPYSTLSLNQSYHQQPTRAQCPREHHQSMINLNQNYHAGQSCNFHNKSYSNHSRQSSMPQSRIDNEIPSPAMSASPPPAPPPLPPMRPGCARCRFSSASTNANAGMPRHSTVSNSNSHLHSSISHQNSNYGMQSNNNSYGGEYFLYWKILRWTQKSCSHDRENNYYFAQTHKTTILLLSYQLSLHNGSSWVIDRDN